MSANTYTESQLMTQLRRELAKLSREQPQEYASRWQTQLDSVIGQILNREDFQYDLNTDALFSQYEDRYVNLGQQAMADTLGQLSTLTGGYGNSYAQYASQQAYQSQLQGLYDRIPELYRLALERYQLKGQNLAEQYSLLSGLDSRDYGRYRDQRSDALLERDYLTGRLDAERGFDYGAYRDTVADSQWQQEFDEGLRRFNFENRLGEFAPSAIAWGSSSSGTGKNVDTKQEQIQDKLRRNKKRKEDTQ